MKRCNDRMKNHSKPQKGCVLKRTTYYYLYYDGITYRGKYVFSVGYPVIALTSPFIY